MGSTTSDAEREEMMIQDLQTGPNESPSDRDCKARGLISRGNAGRLYKTLFGVSVVINVSLVAIMVYVAITFRLNSLAASQSADRCHDSNTQTKPLTHVGRAESALYGDLANHELQEVLAFLYSQSDIKLSPFESAHANSSFIHSIELLPPKKSEVMKYLAVEGILPLRYAKVTISNSELAAMETYKVGPIVGHVWSIRMEKITNPTASVPSRVGQVTVSEFWRVFETLSRYIDLHHILSESYGATLFQCIHDNEHLCLVAYQYYLPVSSSEERKIWIAFYYDVEYYTLHPVDIQVLLNVDSPNSDDWKIESVWYGGILYNSYEYFTTAYYNNNIPKMNLTFPDSVDQKRGSLTMRSTVKEENPRRGPVQFEPDGKRYSIGNNTVEYQRWRFSWQNTILSGPHLNNVEFDNTTIVYELGLQDIAVIYTGNDPVFSRAAFADGFNSLGTKTFGLVPGVDCPEHATFLNISLISEGFLSYDVMPNAICVFEHNTGIPLRRHHSNAEGQGGTFYGGLVANVLVFRTIFVINNYDYIMDYRFFENGALEVKIYPTGYVLMSYSSDAGMDYGYQIGDNSIAPYHLHLFHFKVDLDVLGTKNRYKTVDVDVESFTSPVQEGDSNGPQYRYRLKENVKTHEMNAATRTNDKDAKYHLFYNENEKNIYGHHRAFQIQSKDSVEQILPEGYGFESSIPWSRYKMAVTKRKETEDRSSSAHASLDAGQPIVDFQTFLQDNESIVDEDLVVWLTLGMHHIPQTEDIPNTATPGRVLSFIIKPFNYHVEDPSMTSRDSVRLTPAAADENRGRKVEIERYGTKEGYDCVPKGYDYDALRSDGSSIFPSFN